MDGKPPLATSEEVAGFLRVSVHTLDRWARDGTGPPFTRAGRRGHRRYAWPQVDAWLLACAPDGARPVPDPYGAAWEIVSARGLQVTPDDVRALLGAALGRKENHEHHCDGSS